MNYSRYNRDVVMLSEQSDQFAAREGAVLGHLKIETGNNKGAMRCQVENLQHYGKGEYLYKLIFFGTKNERTIYATMGNIIVNKNGGGETYFRFSPVNMDGKGNDYSDFSTAIIAAVSTEDEKEPMHPVLKGPTGNESESEPRQGSGRKAGRENQKVTAAAEGETTKERLPQETVCEEERKNFNRFYNDYLLHVCGHTCRIAEFYEEVRPFYEDKTGVKWKKIVNILNLPLVSPGAKYFATQYQHYLFGTKNDLAGTAEFYYFAVPGRFSEAEIPDGGRSGFTFWQPVAGASYEKNAYGYWMVAVDAKNGDIVEAQARTKSQKPIDALMDEDGEH